MGLERRGKVELLTVQEVADIIQVKYKTLWNWINGGKFPQEAIFRMGNTVRIKKNALEKLLA